MMRRPLVMRLYRVASNHYPLRIQRISFVAGALIGLWLLWLRSLPHRRVI